MLGVNGNFVLVLVVLSSILNLPSCSKAKTIRAASDHDRELRFRGRNRFVTICHVGANQNETKVLRLWKAWAHLSIHPSDFAGPCECQDSDSEEPVDSECLEWLVIQDSLCYSPGYGRHPFWSDHCRNGPSTRSGSSFYGNRMGEECSYTCLNYNDGTDCTEYKCICGVSAGWGSDPDTDLGSNDPSTDSGGYILTNAAGTTLRGPAALLGLNSYGRSGNPNPHGVANYAMKAPFNIKIDVKSDLPGRWWVQLRQLKFDSCRDEVNRANTNPIGWLYGIWGNQQDSTAQWGRPDSTRFYYVPVDDRNFHTYEFDVEEDSTIRIYKYDDPNSKNLVVGPIQDSSAVGKPFIFTAESNSMPASYGHENWATFTIKNFDLRVLKSKLEDCRADWMSIKSDCPVS